jgi:thiamine-phosphate pyrophosphorylase
LPEAAHAHELGERLRVYLVADPEHVRGDFIEMVGAAIRGGVTAVQLRSKLGTDRATLAMARKIRLMTVTTQTLFFVNDRIDIALACGADGVHLGVDDLDIEMARSIGGPDFLIGYSPDTDQQAQDAAAQGASYLGVGPVFGTATKSDAGQAIGLDGIRHRAELVDIPIIGIGGINARNAASVIEAGAVGVAVVSAISMQSDPRAAAAALSRALNRCRQ